MTQGKNEAVSSNDAPAKSTVALEDAWNEARTTLTAEPWSDANADKAIRNVEGVIDRVKAEIQKNREDKAAFENKIGPLRARAGSLTGLKSVEPPADVAVGLAKIETLVKVRDYAKALETLSTYEKTLKTAETNIYHDFSERTKALVNAAKTYKGKIKAELDEAVSFAGIRAQNDLKSLKKELEKTGKRDLAGRLATLDEIVTTLEKETLDAEDAYEEFQKQVGAAKAMEARKDFLLKKFEAAIEDTTLPQIKRKPAIEGKADIEEAWPNVTSALESLDAEVLSDAIKSVGRVLAALFRDVEGKEEAEQAALAAQAQYEAQQLARYDNAVAWGDGHFPNGHLASVWEKVHETKGNDSIGKTLHNNLIDALVQQWQAQMGGDGDLVSNLHVPGGMAQPKWVGHAKPRDDIQVNFCCYWNGKFCNVHVDVEPNSFFEANPDGWDVQEMVDRDVIWKKLKSSTRQLLRDSFPARLVNDNYA